MLFNIVIADLKKEMQKVKWRRIRLGKRKVYTLAYADDIVLLSDKERMRNMIGRMDVWREKDWS